MKLLIEIWGNYHAWKEVTYTYDNKTINSSTTLPLLLDSIKPDTSIIIVGDTLLEQEIAKNKITFDNNNSSYDNVCSIVKDSTQQFINRSLENFDVKAFANSISVLVTPAVGTFSHTRFNGNPHNFFSYLYYSLAKTVVTIAQKTHDPLEIYVDITHGINYMTMMTYRAVKDICSILAYFFDVTFIVLNSDPYVGSENKNLNINQIEKTKIKPQFNFFKYPQFDNGRWLKITQNMPNEKKAQVNASLQEQLKEFSALISFVEECYCFASAVYNALPLFLVCFFPDIQTLSKTIDSMVSIFFKNISMHEADKLTVQQQLDFTPSFVSLLQILLFAQCCKYKYNIEKQDQCNISILHNLIKLYSSFSAFKSRIYRELSKIEEAIHQSSLPLSTYEDYGKIRDEKNYKPSDTVDERNFFAHSGLTYTNIQIKKEGDAIFIKPKKESIADIKKVLQNNIATGLE